MINKVITNIDKLLSKCDYIIDKKILINYRPPMIDEAEEAEVSLPPRDNLIYNKAEPWARENFESFLSSVIVWVSTSKPNKLPGVLLQFEVFRAGLLGMDNLGFNTDKERLDWVKNQLKYMVNKMEHTEVPEEILNKADAIFWGN
jgi:hypothetical protein